MINRILLREKAVKELRKQFKGNNPNGLQIDGFMQASEYKKFLKSIYNAKFRKNEIRDTHSFFQAAPDALNYFRSKEFIAFVSVITGRNLRKCECSLRIFLKGCYTLMNDRKLSGIEFTFDLTPELDIKNGGYSAYLTNDGRKLAIKPSPNMLVLSLNGKSYVKYVNHKAKGSRLMVYGVLG